MEPAPSAPAQADTSLRPHAQQRGPGTHVHGLALLRLLLLLLLALFGRRAPAPRRDWFTGAHAASYGDTSLEDFERSPAYRRLRARLGWILRGTRNRGMAPTGAAPLRARPERSARAPPRAPCSRTTRRLARPAHFAALPGPMARVRRLGLTLPCRRAPLRQTCLGSSA